MDLILPIIGQILDFILQYLYVSQCNFDVFTFEGISICGKFEEFIRFFTKFFQFIFTCFTSKFPKLQALELNTIGFSISVWNQSFVDFVSLQNAVFLE